MGETRGYTGLIKKLEGLTRELESKWGLIRKLEGLTRKLEGN